MVKELQNLEKAFQEAFKGKRMQPSAGLLRRLRFRLWVSDFFSLQPRKLNIFYTVFLTGGIASGILLTTNTKNKAEDLKEEITISEKTDEKGAISEGNIPSINNNTEKEAAPIPEARFNVTVREGCVPFQVNFENTSKNIERSHWEFGNGDFSAEPNPSYTFNTSGIFNVVLNVEGKNNASDSYSQIIKVREKPKAKISINIEESEIGKRNIVFINRSEGSEKFLWEFGDSQVSNRKNPVHHYDDFGIYNVILIAESGYGCTDTAKFTNKFIAANYELSFPLNFHPNEFGRNNNGFYEQAGSETSVFYPVNEGVIDYKLSIYASNGIEVFSTKNIKQGWNGYINARIAPAGIYSYKASGVYPNNKNFDIEGFFKVIRDTNYPEY
ncbi:MAG: hypothetical protein JW894_06240 [Bacteroidales bacterium]|nr:hypothetical protein [Bacteroidales bacterium]